VKILKATGIT